MTTECESTSAASLVDPSSENRAIAVCTEAWTRAHQSVMKGNRGRLEAEAAAAAAYRRTLPTLSGLGSIRDFIACVAYGMAIGAIEGACASRLLYAAQVAKGLLRPSSAGKKHSE